MNNFEHLQTIKFDVVIGDKVTPKIAIFNCNKLPLGVAVQCIENDTYNKYLLILKEDQYNALFLDDNGNDGVTNE